MCPSLLAAEHLLLRPCLLGGAHLPNALSEHERLMEQMVAHHCVSGKSGIDKRSGIKQEQAQQKRGGANSTALAGCAGGTGTAGS